MSTHIYDNLKVNQNFIMNTGGTISSSAVDLQLVPDTDRMLNIGLNGLSNQKTIAGNISKTMFVTSTLTNANIGNNVVPLFNVAVTGSTVGGFKTFISLTDGQVSERFDEFMGSFQGNTTFAPQVYQLSSFCLGNLSIGGIASSLTASSISGDIYPFSYSFPYNASHTVQVSCCIEWYGTADACFGSAGSIPVVGSNSGLTAPSTSANSGGNQGSGGLPAGSSTPYYLHASGLCNMVAQSDKNYLAYLLNPFGGPEATISGNGSISDFAFQQSLPDYYGSAWVAPTSGNYIVSATLEFKGSDGNIAHIALLPKTWDGQTPLTAGIDVIDANSTCPMTDNSISYLVSACGTVQCTAGDLVYLVVRGSGQVLTTSGPENTFTVLQVTTGSGGSSGIQPGSSATLHALEAKNSIHIDAAPDSNTVPLRIEGTPQGSNGTAVSIGGAGVVSIDLPGYSGGRFMLNDQGQLGLNQTNPQHTLDVNGSINATGDILLNGVSLTSSFGTYAILHDSSYPDGAITPAKFDSGSTSQLSAVSLDFFSSIFTVNYSGMYTITWNRWITNHNQAAITTVQQTWNLTITDVGFNSFSSTSNDYVGRDSQSRYFQINDTFTINLHPTGNLQLYSPTAVTIMFTKP